MKQITILATSDIHGYTTAASGQGGFSTLAALFSQAEAPILIDNGDMLVGSPLATYYNSTFDVSPVIQQMNELGYDVMVPGNHDFDYGIAFLQRQAAAFNGAYLCANVVSETDQPLFSPYTVIERGDVKVGIIGVITKAMPQICSYSKIGELKFLDVVTTVKKWLPIVENQADIVILSYHGGIERNLQTGKPTQYDTGEDEVYRLLQEFPAVNGLICGHQHRHTSGIYRDTVYVQPGYRGEFVGEMTFQLDDQLQLQKRTAQLLPNTASTSKCQLVHEDAAYASWLQQPFAVSTLLHYLQEEYTYDFYLLDIGSPAPVMKELLDSFKPPYTLLTYHLSRAELASYLADCSHLLTNMPNKADALTEDSYRVISNTQLFPAYRIEQQHIHNVFDDCISYEVTRGGKKE